MDEVFARIECTLEKTKNFFSQFQSWWTNNDNSTHFFLKLQMKIERVKIVELKI